MKALLFFLVSLPLGASVTDLEYLPAKGNLYYKNQLAFQSQNQSETVLNTKEKIDRSKILFKNTLTFGVIENLEMGADLNFVIKDDTTIEEQTVSGAAQTPGVNYSEEAISNSGMEDPFINARYRLPILEETINVDFLGAFSFSMADAERGDVAATPIKRNLEGNAYWGGHRVRLGANMNQNKDDWQWSLGLTVQMNLEREIKQQDASTNTHSIIKTDAYNDFEFEGKILCKAMEKLHLMARLAFLIQAEQEQSNLNNTAQTFTEEGHSDILLGLRAYWLFTENLVVNLGGEYTSFAERDFKTFQSQALFSTKRIKSADQTSFHAGIDWGF